MLETTSRYVQLVNALKAADHRLTPQRLELIRMITASDGHPSASQLYSKIRMVFPTISLATVYKTLALLKQMGQVLEIDLHGDSRYDGNRSQSHPHLVCLDCLKIMDGEVLLDEESVRRVLQTSGFKILRPNITLYGLCSDCQVA